MTFSTELLFKSAEKQSVPAPTAENSSGREFVGRGAAKNELELCSAHSRESVAFAQADANGWPTELDFFALPTRLDEAKPKYDLRVSNIESSESYKAAVNKLEGKTAGELRKSLYWTIPAVG